MGSNNKTTDKCCPALVLKVFSPASFRCSPGSSNQNQMKSPLPGICRTAINWNRDTLKDAGQWALRTVAGHLSYR